MQMLLRPLAVPFHFWRTIVFTTLSGLLIAELFHDQIAVMLSTVAASFFFAGYERRRWISVSSHFQMGDILMRFSFGLLLSYWLCQRFAH